MDYEHDISFEKGQFVEIKGYVKITSKLMFINIFKFLKIYHFLFI